MAAASRAFDVVPSAATRSGHSCASCDRTHSVSFGLLRAASSWPAAYSNRRPAPFPVGDLDGAETPAGSGVSRLSRSAAPLRHKAARAVATDIPESMNIGPNVSTLNEHRTESRVRLFSALRAGSPEPGWYAGLGYRGWRAQCASPGGTGPSHSFRCWESRAGPRPGGWALRLGPKSGPRRT